MSEPVTREFSVVLSKKAALVVELERLARRAAKISAPAITWSFGEVEQREVAIPRCDGSDRSDVRLVPFVRLTLTGTRPVVAGWEFAATVQHLDGANVLRHTPDFADERDVPETFRTRGPVCDHCQSRRLRRDTYLLVSEAGEWKQVGSSCLVDFLGHADPHALAAYAELLASAVALCEGADEDAEDGWGFGGGGRSVFAVLEFLAHAAAEIRESGWTPKSAVPECLSQSTAERTLDRIAPTRDALRENPRDRSVLESDRAVAAATLEWALSLGSGDERLGDYLWNLHAVAKGGVVEYRTAGIAASMVAAHTKAEVRRRERAARKPSEYVGAVGETRSFAIFLDRHLSFETAWGMIDRYLFRDANDCVLTWKSSGNASVIGAEHPNNKMVEGERYVLTARVKEHGEYKGTKQTVLTLAAVRPYSEAIYQALRDEEVRKALGKKVRAGQATAEEAAEFQRLDGVKRAASKASADKVRSHAFFETTLRTISGWAGGADRTVVDVPGGVWIEYDVSRTYGAWDSQKGNRPVVETASINVHADGRWACQYAGKDALDKARIFVAKKLAAAASDNGS
jgi:hypothetical protein